MNNLYINVPFPAVNGPGASVDVSGMAGDKTALIAPITVGTMATLQGSNDGGITWTDIIQLGIADSFYAVMQLARVFRTAHNPSQPLPTVTLGAEEENLNAPAFMSPKVTIVIYARTTGSDTTGDGTSIATAYRTTQRARLDVPYQIPDGIRYRIDNTGIGLEVFPPDYSISGIRGSEPIAFDFFDPDFFLTTSFCIRATPQPVALPLGEAFITFADVLSITTDPKTGAQILTLVAARGSWGGNALAGKQTHGLFPLLTDGTIRASTTTTLEINLPPGLFLVPGPFPSLTIVEPSAVWSGSSALNPLASIFMFDMASFQLQGQGFTNATAISALGILFSSETAQEMCSMKGFVTGPDDNSIVNSDIHTNVLGLAAWNYNSYHCSYRNIPAFVVSGQLGGHFIGMMTSFENCPALGPRPDQNTGTGHSDEYSVNVNGAWFRGSRSDGFVPASACWLPGGTSSLYNVDCAGSLGDGIIVEDNGFCEMTNVNGGTGAPGDPANAGIGVRAPNGKVRIRDSHPVIGATFTTPIAITTLGTHGLVTGASVFVVGVTGNLGANGGFLVTVTGPSTFTLDGSVGTGIYTGGGFVLAAQTFITGLGGDMKSGNLPVRPWADFLTMAPVGNEYDLTTPFVLNVLSGNLMPPGDELTGPGSGGRTGSRIFKQP